MDLANTVRTGRRGHSVNAVPAGRIVLVAGPNGCDVSPERLHAPDCIPQGGTWMSDHPAYGVPGGSGTELISYWR